jgi:hypothetical protein
MFDFSEHTWYPDPEPSTDPLTHRRRPVVRHTGIDLVAVITRTSAWTCPPTPSDRR